MPRGRRRTIRREIPANLLPEFKRLLLTFADQSPLYLPKAAKNWKEARNWIEWTHLHAVAQDKRSEKPAKRILKISDAQLEKSLTDYEDRFGIGDYEKRKNLLFTTLAIITTPDLKDVLGVLDCGKKKRRLLLAESGAMDLVGTQLEIRKTVYFHAGELFKSLRWLYSRGCVSPEVVHLAESFSEAMNTDWLLTEEIELIPKRSGPGNPGKPWLKKTREDLSELGINGRHAGDLLQSVGLTSFQ